MTYSVRRALTSLCAAGWDSKTAAGVLQAWAWLKSVCGRGPVFDKRFPKHVGFDGTDYDTDNDGFWR